MKIEKAVNVVPLSGGSKLGTLGLDRGWRERSLGAALICAVILGWGLQVEYKQLIFVGLMADCFISKKLKFSQAFLFVFLGLVTLLLLFLLFGVINGAPSEAVISYVKVWLIYPFIASILVSGQIKNREDFFLDNCSSGLLAASLIALSLLVFSLVTGDTAFVNYFSYQISINEIGSLTISNAGSTAFFVGATIIFAKILYKSKPADYVTFFACSSLVILSGRRSFILILLILPICYYLIKILLGESPSNKAMKGLTVFFFGYLFLGLVIVCAMPAEAVALIGLITKEFDGDAIRRVQESALFEMIASAPLLGHGLAVPLPLDVVREVERPWIVELTFHVLMANVGLLGFVVIVLLISVPVFFCVGRQSSDTIRLRMVFIFPAALLVLVSYTNPYLAGIESTLILVSCLMSHSFKSKATRE